MVGLDFARLDLFGLDLAWLDLVGFGFARLGIRVVSKLVERLICEIFYYLRFIYSF